MKKNYIIRKDKVQVGYIEGVELSPRFLKHTDLEYVEVPAEAALEHLADADVASDGRITENLVRKAERKAREEHNEALREILRDPVKTKKLRDMLK